MIHKRYKSFRNENLAFKDRDDELRSLYDYIGDNDVDRFALKFYINEKYPVKDKFSAEQTMEKEKQDEAKNEIKYNDE